jgi:hypothetical protein
VANIFICHRGGDSDSASRLATELSSHGHDVWLDIWKIDIGDSIVNRINEGLTGATYLVLCLSDSGFSAWMNAEWMATLARQLNGENVSLLPIRLTGGELPAIIGDRKCADLVRDWNDGVKSLLQAIQRK